jgi:septum site-determining protein MinC
LKNKQYSVKVYECSIEDENEFIFFFDANYTLFKDHLIVVNGEMSSTIKSYLDKKSLTFLNNIALPKGRTRKALERELHSESKERAIDQMVAQSELAKLSDRLEQGLMVLDDMIRSGQSLNIEGDLLLLNRLNSGASIEIAGNLIITKLVEGLIRCDGNFMILMASPKANIIFHGVELENQFLENRLNRVEFKNNEIIITPVFKRR